MIDQPKGPDTWEGDKTEIDPEEVKRDFEAFMADTTTGRPHYSENIRGHQRDSMRIAAALVLEHVDTADLRRLSRMLDYVNDWGGQDCLQKGYSLYPKDEAFQFLRKKVIERLLRISVFSRDAKSVKDFFHIYFKIRSERDIIPDSALGRFVHKLRYGSGFKGEGMIVQEMNPQAAIDHIRSRLQILLDEINSKGSAKK